MRTVKISIHASKNIAKISNYIDLKWSEKVRKEFIKKVNNTIIRLEKVLKVFRNQNQKKKLENV